MESFILLDTSVLVYHQLWKAKYMTSLTIIVEGFTHAAN